MNKLKPKPVFKFGGCQFCGGPLYLDYDSKYCCLYCARPEAKTKRYPQTARIGFKQ